MAQSRARVEPLSARIFILSPASCSGKRAQMLLHPEAEFDLAQRLRRHGATVAEVFTFLSGLYFRGKLSYAERFARPPDGVAGAYAITSNRGLVELDHVLRRSDVEAFDRVEIDAREPLYARPLRRTAKALAERLTGATDVVLLGSVASGKYADILVPVFRQRLQFPASFVGRGDMSRGGLMLRSARDGQELDYVAVAGAVLHGTRPPKLRPETRSR